MSKHLGLYRNYHNPFNPSVTTTYGVPTKSVLMVATCDVLSREVKRVVDQEQNAGQYKFIFIGDKNASGIYFCGIVAENFASVKKMVLTK